MNENEKNRMSKEKKPKKLEWNNQRSTIFSFFQNKKCITNGTGYLRKEKREKKKSNNFNSICAPHKYEM